MSKSGFSCPDCMLVEIRDNFFQEKSGESQQDWEGWTVCNEKRMEAS